MNPNGCAVASGEWFDPYTDRTFTDPGDLDVDHVAALADAWVSGARKWAYELLDRFSNDLGNLNAIAAGENRSKSAKGPAENSPAAPAPRCEYLLTRAGRRRAPGGTAAAPAARCDDLVQYVSIKIRRALEITPQDFEVMATGLTGCDAGITPDTAAAPTTTTTTAPPPPTTTAPAAPPPTTTPAAPVPDCHRAYDPCLPDLPGDVLNCGDLRRDQKPVTVLRPGDDPYRFDRDRDGRGCTS